MPTVDDAGVLPAACVKIIGEYHMLSKEYKDVLSTGENRSLFGNRISVA